MLEGGRVVQPPPATPVPLQPGRESAAGEGGCNEARWLAKHPPVGEVVSFVNDAFAPALNSTVTTTRLNTFLCPSCPAPGYNLNATAPLNQYTAPGNNYFDSFGSCLEFAATSAGGPPSSPAFVS